MLASSEVLPARDGPKATSSSKRPAAEAVGSGTALAMARGMGAAALRTVLAWQAVRLVCRLIVAACLALVVGQMIEGGALAACALFGALAAIAGATAAGLMGELQAARGERDVVIGLNRKVAEALSLMPAAWVARRAAGELVAGAERHPPALAALVLTHATNRTMLTAGPALTAVAMAGVSLPAALALILATPIMIVFLVLIGGIVRRKAEVEEATHGRLAAQFADRIRTLPTILASHALSREAAKIESRMRDYAQSTLDVLTVAFLNAGLIDFFASVSVAMLAVLLGLGHLGLVTIHGLSGLRLWQSLFLLVAAAEYFVAFRRYSESYHAGAQGMAAAEALDWYFDIDPSAFAPLKHEMAALHAAGGIAGRGQLPRLGLVALTGPSGSGKSTLMRLVAGDGGSADPRAWISTDIFVPAGSLAEVLAWNRPRLEPGKLLAAAECVGLTNERLLPGGLAARIEDGGSNLSGGQKMRLGVARALLSDGTIFADEPTAKLDAATAELVRCVLTEEAKRRLVVVVTHDRQLIGRADHRIDLSLCADHFGSEAAC